MHLASTIRRACLIFGVTGLAVLGAAQAAAAIVAPSVSLTRFSSTVSGVAPAGATSVTVDLLRNIPLNSHDGVGRNQVASFTATPDGTGAWSGSFTSHAFSSSTDQVEINYSPAPSVGPTQLTIGGGQFLPGADNGTTTEQVSFPADTIQNHGYFISSDGTQLHCGCNQFKVSVDGGTPSASSSSPYTFPTPVTNANSVAISESQTDGTGETTITLTALAPLRSLANPVTTADPTPGDHTITGSPFCDAYLVTHDVVCSNLTPGNYTLTDGGTSGTITVPAATTTGNGDQLFVPSKAGMMIPGLAPGQQVRLSLVGGRTLTTLTVGTLKLNVSSPLGDLLNGAPTTVGGACTAGDLLEIDPNTVCTAGSLLPAMNDLGSDSVGELDDSSAGSTFVVLPQVDSSTPRWQDSVFTPFHVMAMPRYTDPLARMAAQNIEQPPVGPSPTIPSTPSADPVVFQYAPVGSTAFVTLGNVNVAGGLVLPALAPGQFVGRYTLTDSVGGTTSFDTPFYSEGQAVTPGPPAPRCTASSTGHLKASIAKKSKKGKKKSKKKQAITVMVSCSSAMNGARVAVWLQRGSTVATDGSGVVKNGNVKIKLSGALKKGTYQLLEVIDFNGQSTDASHTVTLK